MTRKSLSNLLRNEASKPSETDEPGTEPETSVIEPNAEPAATSTESGVTITELKEALEEAEQREFALQQKVTTLRADLDANKQLTAKLQEEFAQAKEVILKLADANSKLAQQPDTNSIISQATDKKLEDDARLAKLNSVQYGSLPNFAPAESDIGSWLG